jgi:hypothetical protein
MWRHNLPVLIVIGVLVAIVLAAVIASHHSGSNVFPIPV